MENKLNEHNKAEYPPMHTAEFDISQISDDAFVVIIDEDIYSKKELLDILNERMKFPPYFGFNWDALHDLLSDFYWVKSFDIFLIHKGKINLPDNDFRIYMELLQDALILWNNDKEHKFHVHFEL